jgi:competence protein ComK
VKKVRKEEYLINSDTMVLLPHYNEDGHLYSLVMELKREFIVYQKPKEIIDRSCLYYGSSYQGRVDGATHLTKYNRMVPIMICNRSGIFFFPTQSPKSEACIWFAHEHITQIVSINAENCQVVLGDLTAIPVRISRAAMESKVNRAAQYRHIMAVHEKGTEKSLDTLRNLEQSVIIESTGAYTFNGIQPSQY